MDKEATMFLKKVAVALHIALEGLEVLHSIITDQIIQEGEPNVKDTNNPDIGGN